MINLTNSLVIIAEDISEKIREALDTVQCELQSRYGDEPATYNWNGSHGFQLLFGRRNIRTQALFDKEFVDVIYTIAQLPSQNKDIRVLMERLAPYLGPKRAPAHALRYIKQGCKLLIVELWEKNVLLLPTSFSTGTHFEPVKSANELFNFCSSFEHKWIAKSDENSAEEARRIFFYIPCVLRATNWKSVEDFDILEYAQLHLNQRKLASSKATTKKLSTPPWTPFLSQLQAFSPERVQFSKEDIQNYSSWMLSKKSNEISFSDYINMTLRDGRNENGKPLAIQPDYKERAVSAPKSISPDGIADSIRADLLLLSDSSKHDDAVRYFTQFRSKKRSLSSNILPDYPGREHCNVGELSKHWMKAISSYRNWRQLSKEYESESVDSTLNILVDYIFLYLPWWIELFPESDIKFPKAPSAFTRYRFVAQTNPVPIDELPLSLLEMVAKRRAGGTTRNSAVSDLWGFFEYVKSYFSEDDEMAGSKFVNPIQRVLDKKRGNTPTKTTKNVVPKGCFQPLVDYAYAVESFGIFLQESMLAGSLKYGYMKKKSSLEVFNSADFGYIPIVMVRDRFVAVHSVPNVFAWHTRLVKKENAESSSYFLPHLTTFRIIIAAIECGLRVAGIRWLDRRKWNKGNMGKLQTSSTYKRNESFQKVFDLRVATDKVKKLPWDTVIIYRLHEVLLREQNFQEQFADINAEKPVNYEGRANSRFEPIVPLFRAHTGGIPISHSTVSKYWFQFFLEFQSFYQMVSGTNMQFIIVKPALDTDGEPLSLEEDGLHFTPINYYAISTPHAGRATFATNRAGLIEASEIAKMLGQSSEIQAIYYQKPSEDDLREKLEKSDAIVMGFAMFDSNSPAFIRADREDSSLVKAFRANKEKTLKEFGFMPSLALWDTADLDDISNRDIEKLRNGPMSSVRFFDTNICPVGGECPAKIVEKIGGFKRCGLCPLAMKCVDHLPAIAAKKNVLIERVQFLFREKNALIERGEESLADNVWEESELDTNELLAWTASEEKLLEMLAVMNAADRGSMDNVLYLVDQPDIVRNHLTHVVRSNSSVEFILTRIAESNAYPSMESPILRGAAAAVKKRLMANKGSEEFITLFDSPSSIPEVASLLASVMRTHNLSLPQVSERLFAPAPQLSQLNPMGKILLGTTK